MATVIARLNAYFNSVEAAGRPISDKGLRTAVSDLSAKIKRNKLMIDGMKDRIKRAPHDTSPTKLQGAHKQIAEWQAEITTWEEQLVRRKSQARERKLTWGPTGKRV